MAPFTHSFRARWVLFLESHGWTMNDFQTRQIGPVVLEDKLTYKKELKLLEAFRVDLQLAAGTEDLGRIKVRNRFFRES